jgi:hypothetical protein
MGSAIPKPLRPATKMAFGKDTSPSNVKAVKKSAPTQAEVSQSSAMDQDGYDGVSRKTKRRGRSATIITGSTGVEEGLTLGKKSLLGQ